MPPPLGFTQVFTIVRDDGEADFLTRLLHSITDRSEAATELAKLTTYNSCFETVDALLKEYPLGSLTSGQSSIRR